MAGRDWVKAIGKKLREDMGDCPTLSDEMLELLGKMKNVKDDVIKARALASVPDRAMLPVT